MPFIECEVLAEQGIYYGSVIPNPDPTKPAIDMRRLYEKGEKVMIDEKEYVDFEKMNAERNKSRGHSIEVSYRATGNRTDPLKAAAMVGIDIEAIKAQIKSELEGVLRAQLKAEMEANALRPHNPTSAVKGK